MDASKKLNHPQSVQNAKSKMSNWWPSWILGGIGFQKEPSPSEAQPTNKFQVNLPIRSCITVRNTKSKMSTRPGGHLGFWLELVFESVVVDLNTQKLFSFNNISLPQLHKKVALILWTCFIVDCGRRHSSISDSIIKNRK
jgi:hypothetical protein